LKKSNIINIILTLGLRMKNIKNYAMLFIISILIMGCYGIFSENERLPQGDFDIVFQTENDGNDIIGFYSLGNNEFDFLQTTKNLSSPYVLD